MQSVLLIVNLFNNAIKVVERSIYDTNQLAWFNTQFSFLADFVWVLEESLQ